MRRSALITIVLVCLILAPLQNVYGRPALDTQVDSLLRQMTLSQRVGQLFMVSFDGQALTERTLAFLQEMQPGAIALFSYNAGSPAETTQTINNWQQIATQSGAKIPLLVAVDEEGGPVDRLVQGFTAMPWGAALGAMPVEHARLVGQIEAEELKAVGINMNLAPVVDVRSIPNQFIERRTLGADPHVVGKAASAYVQGLADGDVIGVLKHFPGHGPAGDSHNMLPLVSYDLEQVETIELPPYRIAIQNGAQVVMVGHLVYPALDPTPNMPASLSPLIIEDVLRKRLGFNGVAMTDAMDMAAIVNYYSRPIASVMAIQAGIDLIATGPHTPISEQLAMKQAIIDAVNRGDISQARIEEAVRRVLTLKAQYGLLTWKPLRPDQADQRVKAAVHQKLVDQIYLDTVQILRDSNNLLPLKSGPKKVALIYPGIFPSIQRECTALGTATTTLAYTLNPTGDQQATVRRIAASVDVVVIFTYNIVENPNQTTLVNRVPPGKAIVVALQDPYDIEYGIEPSAYVAAYNSYPSAFKAACAVLYGVEADQESLTLDPLAP
jgi:beta-N-acetylhexosaminidase